MRVFTRPELSILTHLLTYYCCQNIILSINILGGFCPGDFVLGGFCPRGDFVLGGILSRGILSGDFVRGGLSGGFCPDTV